MTISENSDTFLADFGQAVSWGIVSDLGILDQPDELVGQYGVSTQYELTVKASKFAAVIRGDVLTVGGVSYTAREAFRLISDGVFGKIALTKT